MSRHKHLYHEMRLPQNSYNDEEEDSEWQTNKQLLFSSVKDGNLPQLRDLLDYGVLPNFKNEYQQTPLHIAMLLDKSNANLEIIRLLIAFGCPINAQDVSGVSALHMACHKLRAEYVCILLEAGCNVNIQDDKGMSPLMQTILGCTRYSRPPWFLFIIQLLVEWGADVNIRDALERNVLVYVVYKLDLLGSTLATEVIYLLLNVGIEVNYRVKKLNDQPFAKRLIECMTARPCSYLLVLLQVLCAGCQILEHKSCQTALLQRFETWRNVGTQDLNKILEYLLDIFIPVCSLKTLRSFRNELKSVEHLRDMPEVLKLDTVVTNVKSLKCLSRIAIRKRLNNQLFVKVDKLGLPRELVDYLKYSECKPASIT